MTATADPLGALCYRATSHHRRFKPVSIPGHANFPAGWEGRPDGLPRRMHTVDESVGRDGRGRPADEQRDVTAELKVVGEDWRERKVLR
jgi:hypothetical protein